jgi:hypothetical protein
MVDKNMATSRFTLLRRFSILRLEKEHESAPGLIGKNLELITVMRNNQLIWRMQWMLL